MRNSFFYRVQPLNILCLLLAITLATPSFAQRQPKIMHIVFTSDAHYGLKRKAFRGDSNVTSHTVNAAMIDQINTLPNLQLPDDDGVAAGEKTGAIDYVIETGDIANRMEIPIQTAAASWKEFEADYMHRIKLTAWNGKPAELLLAPGNHDISNAIGYYKPMQPLTDPSSMVNIYNFMLKPKKPMTTDRYNYADHKINYSRNINGIHFMFLTLWPDSAQRIWMARDLEKVALTTPVFIFTHDQPTSEAVHFKNPVPPHQMTPENKFENLTTEYYKEGTSAAADNASTDIEQRGLTGFLKAHPNIVAYFHGNSNWTEFYDYTGPDHDVNVKVFRVDSPMKGKYSSKNEKLLSFELVSVDAEKQQLTVRECLWNTQPGNAGQPVVFGKSRTVSFKPVVN